MDLLSKVSSLDKQIEKMDVEIGKLNLFEPSEQKVAELKSVDVMQAELEFEDQLSAQGIVWLLEKNNRLAEQILFYTVVEKNILNDSSLSDEDRDLMLDTTIMARRSSIEVMKNFDKEIEKQEKGFDEMHSDCGCGKMDNDIMNYSKMNPGELKDLIERDGDGFWVGIGMSDLEDDKKKLFLGWMDILAKNYA